MGFFSDAATVPVDFLDVGGATASKEAAEREAAATLEAARASEQFNVEQFGVAQEYFDPFIQREQQASNQLLYEMGLGDFLPEGAQVDEGPPAYQQTDAYSRLREEEFARVNQTAANTGTLYSGARAQGLKSAGANIEGQFYSNYMNMLQNISNPQATQNLAALATGQSASIGQQNIQAQQIASDYQLQGVAASNAARADIGGAASAFGSYFGNQPTSQPSGGSGASGFGDYSNAYDYSGYV